MAKDLEEKRARSGTTTSTSKMKMATGFKRSFPGTESKSETEAMLRKAVVS